MKTLLLFAFIFLFLFPLKAEYNSYHIEITIETTAGKKLKGFVYKTDGFIEGDSIYNPGYLLGALSWDFYGPTDSIRYFKNRFEYKYSFDGTVEERIYALVNPAVIPVSSVVAISIDTVINFSYLLNISNYTSAKDTNWMKKPPVNKVAHDGYLCSYQIYMHKETKKTQAILKELEAYDKKYKDAKDTDHSDEELSKIIHKLNGEKVIVISFCSC